jgi:hypothetical protein
MEEEPFWFDFFFLNVINLLSQLFPCESTCMTSSSTISLGDAGGFTRLGESRAEGKSTCCLSYNLSLRKALNFSAVSGAILEVMAWRPGGMLASERSTSLGDCDSAELGSFSSFRECEPLLLLSADMAGEEEAFSSVGCVVVPQRSGLYVFILLIAPFW